MNKTRDSQGQKDWATIEPQTPQTLSHGKKRKSSRIGNVIRKLLGRKSVKSQISLPTPTAHFHDGSNKLSNSTADPRDQRTVSLPVHHVTRNSALGSHAPVVDLSEGYELSGQLDTGQPRRPVVNRRASMPSAVYAPARQNVTTTIPEHSPSHERSDAGADIGYAVTSGSHPKRRSKSADALHDMAKETVASSTKPEQERRRSDEIRFWRNSLAIGPTIYGSETGPEDAPTPRREFRLQQAQSAFSESQTADSHISHEETESSAEDQENHQSFDFDVIAARLNEQEDIPIEERMMIVEIKLMDLENAIAKTRSPSPPSANTATPRPTGPKASSGENRDVRTPNSKVSRATASQSKSVHGSGSTALGTVSTQPTTSSLSVNAPAIPEQDPFVESKLRPLSTDTALHQPSSGTAESTNSSQPKQPRPVSLTSITIDHYTTLISLIRREQHARIRLENQVAEMQSELFHLMHPHPQQSSSPLSAVSNSGGSLYRSRRWDGSRKDVVKIDNFHVAKRSKSYDGDEGESATGTVMSTDDEYPDVFETPTETKRIELEGRFWGRKEGEAF